MEPHSYLVIDPPRYFVCGSVNGNYRGLLQALERSGFKLGYDYMYTLGDMTTGYPEPLRVIDLLQSMENDCLAHMRGDSDAALEIYLFDGTIDKDWYNNGGEKSVELLASADPEFQQKTLRFLSRQRNYAITHDNFLLLHAGYQYDQPISSTSFSLGSTDIFQHDDELWEDAEATHIVHGASSSLNIADGFERIFISHGTIDNVPIKRCQVWNLNTCNGRQGKVTLMDMNTEEYWQSDRADDLYPRWEFSQNKSTNGQ